MRTIRPSLWLPAVVLICAAALPASVPVLDEESYLDIASQFDLARPYDWVRSWPPWGVGREASAFVFAHPPLFLAWVASLESLLGLGGGSPDAVLLLRLLAATPPALLLGWSVGRLAERTTSLPGLASAVWLSSPVALLGLQRGLMPDLMVTALGTFAIAAWRETAASAAAGKVAWRWMAAGGLALSLAMLTKYPAVLLVGVVMVDGIRRREPRVAALTLAVALAPWLLVEGALAQAYGRPHVLEVILRAGEIPHGRLDARALGVCVRLGLALLPLALLRRSAAWLWLAGFLLAGTLLLFAWPDGASAGNRLAVLGLGTLGGAILVSTAGRLGPRAWRLGDPDTLLLATWALAIVLGVVFGHNFAAPRYLLPAVLPFSLLLIRLAQRRRFGRTVLLATAVGQSVVALLLTGMENRFAHGSSEAMAAALADPRVIQARAGHRLAMTGEWSARWEGRNGGAVWTDGSAVPSSQGPVPLEPGTVILAPRASAPGSVGEGRQRVASFASLRTGRLSVQCIERQISLYSDTMGVLPFGWCPGPVEVVDVWAVQ